MNMSQIVCPSDFDSRPVGTCSGFAVRLSSRRSPQNRNMRSCGRLWAKAQSSWIIRA